MEKGVRDARLENIRYLTRVTKQLWVAVQGRDVMSWQFLSPHCRMQNKFGCGGRGVNGIIPCLTKLSEVEVEINRSEPTEVNDTIKVISDSLVCLLMTVNSRSGDWSIGFAFEWEWGRVVGIVMMHSVDPDAFICNVERRHAITLKQGAFTSIDESKFDWHRKSNHRYLNGVVLSGDECRELIDKCYAECRDFQTALLMTGAEQVFVPISRPDGWLSEQPVTVPYEPSSDTSAQPADSKMSVSGLSVNLPVILGAPTKNAFAKGHNSEKKKVHFASSGMISHILVPKVSIKPVKFSALTENDLFYTPIEFLKFLEQSELDVARTINIEYKLSKKCLTVKEAKEKLYQPDDVVLCINARTTLDEIPLYETAVASATGHDLDALCTAIRKLSSSRMIDEVDRQTMKYKYSQSIYASAEEQTLADIIIPQSKNNSWYISKYARLAYRKLSHKKIDVGGGIANTRHLDSLQHGSNLIMSEIEVSGANDLTDEAGRVFAETTQDAMHFDALLTPDKNNRRGPNIQRGRVAYAAYMLGNRMEPPFCNLRPEGGDVTSLYITVIGCRHLKSPFKRLIPRPVNSFVEIKIGNKSLRTQTKQTDLNPIYDSNTTFVFKLEKIFQDVLNFENGLVQLTVSDQCISVTNIGRTWISLSSLEFTANELNPTLITVPIITGNSPTYFSVRDKQHAGATLPPIATTSKTPADLSHNDMLTAHTHEANTGNDGHIPTISVLISKVNPVVHWMLEELRFKDEQRDITILDTGSNSTTSEIQDVPIDTEFHTWFNSTASTYSSLV